ncbi:hypothetical protein TrVE_jg3164 [Triparma verrucosa]|uniref:ApaG domain-containing protein n=1 Tax=Triparma verrucosa TaxID=1606542 RepID=A0A9W7EQK9_9STRA|nr:hypothetical protein TrVE_jg3164 [Triparma verrucosa]
MAYIATIVHYDGCSPPEGSNSNTSPSSNPPTNSQSPSQSPRDDLNQFDGENPPFSPPAASPSSSPDPPPPVQLLTPSQRSQTYSTLLNLRSKLPPLISSQNFKEAATVQKQIKRLEALDPYYSLQASLDSAISKEWYRTASKLKKQIDRIGGSPLSIKPTSKSIPQRTPRPSKKLKKGSVEVYNGTFPETPNSSSIKKTSGITVSISSSSSPFSYSVSIKNEFSYPIKLVGREFYVQAVGGEFCDVVKGEGVTNRRPVLEEGEVFEYVSNAPIGVKGLGREVGVAARMGGSYFYVKVGEEENVRRAVIGDFHFLLEEE